MSVKQSDKLKFRYVERQKALSISRIFYKIDLYFRKMCFNFTLNHF